MIGCRAKRAFWETLVYISAGNIVANVILLAFGFAEWWYVVASMVTMSFFCGFYITCNRQTKRGDCMKD